MALKQMIIPIRKQVQSLVLRSTGVRLESSGGENKEKGFSHLPMAKGAYIKEISDEKYLMKEWPANPFAYGMNVAPTLICSNVQWDILGSIKFMEGMLAIGVVTLFIVRMAKRLSYGAQISKSDHDLLCEKLKLNMKKETQQEIIDLKYNHKLQMLNAQEEINKLKHSHKSAQVEITILKHSHNLQMLSKDVEIKTLKQRESRQRMESLMLKEIRYF